MRDGGAGRARLAPLGLGAAIVLGFFCAWTTALNLQDDAAAVPVVNVGSVVLAAGGGFGCLRGSRRSTGPARRGWLALAVACWSWAAGQLVWTVLESVLGQSTPYPSAADVGYLGFPVAALAGFVRLATPTTELALPRRLLDSLVVGTAFSLVSWLTVIDAVTAGSAESGLALAVGVAYPVSDVVLLTVTVLTVAQTRDQPRQWALLGAAMLAMTVSDSGFAYRTAAGTYVSGTVVDWGWWAAFCLLAVAGLTVGQEARADRHAEVGDAGVLPYLPLLGAAVVVVAQYANGRSFDAAALSMAVLLVALVLGRQYVTVKENRELARAVQRREVDLQRLAFHDPLTGLANRALFLDRLGHALDLAARDPHPVSVVFIDLDGFKEVNDSLGHAMGDALLVGVAQRLRSALRSVDTLARLGGDEFAVLVEQGADAAAVGQGLLTAVRAPYPINGRTVAVTASIGVATAEPGRPEHAAGLLHRADVAMYAVKAAGKAAVALHSPALDEADGRRASGRPTLGHAFAAALQNGSVYAVFQPAVDPQSGQILAFEALARWTHEGRQIPPAVFVPVCEEAGLSEALTALMLEQSCAQLASWSRELGHHELGMAVNISPTELADADLPVRIDELLRRHGLPPSQLALEITESTLPNRPGVVLDVLNTLRASGIRLALDDFGTGYSTLVRLASTPVDTVKIDRFFLSDIDHDERQLRFLRGLVELTRRLGLRTVAEGVERPGQLVELRRLGCGLVQGHLLARPSTGAALTPAVLAGRSLLPAELILSGPSTPPGGPPASGPGTCAAPSPAATCC